jgi:hypothetical protein
MCDKSCQYLMNGLSFPVDTPVSSINKNEFYDISELLLKVALNINNEIY